MNIKIEYLVVVKQNFKMKVRRNFLMMKKIFT